MNQSYTQEVVVNTNKQHVYEALTNHVDKWWSTVDQKAQKIGDVFKISFGGESFWKFRVIDADINSHVTWLCIASNQDHNLKGMDEEWLHSKLYWKFHEQKDGIQIKFLHKGLQQSGVCYGVCSAAWDFYITDSLKSFLEQGTGKPNAM